MKWRCGETNEKLPPAEGIYRPRVEIRDSDPTVGTERSHRWMSAMCLRLKTVKLRRGNLTMHLRNFRLKIRISENLAREKRKLCVDERKICYIAVIEEQKISG